MSWIRNWYTGPTVALPWANLVHSRVWRWDCHWQWESVYDTPSSPFSQTHLTIVEFPVNGSNFNSTLNTISLVGRYILSTGWWFGWQLGEKIGMAGNRPTKNVLSPADQIYCGKMRNLQDCFLSQSGPQANHLPGEKCFPFQQWNSKPSIPWLFWPTLNSFGLAFHS